MRITKLMSFVSLLAGVLSHHSHAAAPVVNLSRPTNGLTVPVGTSILLRATTSDADGPFTLRTIEFMTGTNLIRRLTGLFTNGTYSSMWTNAPAGTHEVHAEAVDDTGERGVSPSAQILVTNLPPPNAVPVVNVISPTNGATFMVGTPIVLTATATDADEFGFVSAVDFYSDTLNLGRVTGPSSNGVYSLAWTNAPPGMFFVRAEAVDNFGARGVSATVQVAVSGITNGTSPVVNLTRPTNGAMFTLGTRILVTATAVDFDGTLTAIEVLAGTNLLHRRSGLLTNGTYSFMWSNAPAGTHRLRSEAVDNDGNRGVSPTAQILVVATNSPPTNNVLPIVNVISPTNGSTFPAATPVVLTATATDPDGVVTAVDFYSGSSNLGRATGPTTNGIYRLVWTNAAPGMHFVRAEAVDNLGGRGISATVQIGIGGITNSMLPFVTLVRPTNGAVFPLGTRILLMATAMDFDGTLTSLDFLAGTNLLQRRSGFLTNGTYSFMWSNAPVGTHHLSAEAIDNAGNRGASASVRIVIVATNSPPTNNLLPVVQWIQPTNGTVLAPGIPARLTANAVDPDGTVSFVNFYAGSNYLGRGFKALTNSHFTLMWSNPPVGVFQLRAEAQDNAGGRASSGPVQVWVGNLGMADLGTLEVSSIGHHPGGPTNAATAYLIDQDQSSGGGAVLPDVVVNWDTNIQFKLTVAAPPGMRFLVTVQPGSLVRFGGFLWWESTRGGFSPPGEVITSFTDLEGAGFDFSQSDAALSDSHGYFGFPDIDGAWASNTFSFTSITLTATIAPQYTGNGPETYVPHPASALYLATFPPGMIEPGGFAALVPDSPLPLARMTTPPNENGVEILVFGRPGRTHIVECSTESVPWIPISSQIMPPTGILRVSDASATTVGSRFYRVIELP